MVRLLTLLIAVVCAGSVHASERRNVLFLAVDDLRPELGCYGKGHIHSPHIDRLADSGVLFERAYCMVPTCGASRASLMTGVRPSPKRFKTYLTRADQDAPGAVTMNRTFLENGYQAVSLGKVFHHATDSAAGWTEPAWRPKGGRTYQNPDNHRLHQQRQKKGSRSRGPAWEAFDAPEESYADGAIAQHAIEELGRLKESGQPFFLAVGFLKPHLPFVAPQKYWDLYDHSKIQLPENYHPPKGAPEESIHTSGEMRAYAGIPPKGPVSDETARNLIHGYYACVSFTDSLIGKVLAELDRLGLADSTVVVLWGDHGWNLGEHTLWCKHSCYETSMQIPLIVRAPGVRGGERRSALIETIDIYPSLCELAGLAQPSHLEGRSFVELLSDADADWKSAAVGRFKEGDTIRTDGFRYTEYTGRGGQLTSRMLYDHRADPGENVNVAERAADVVEQISGELESRKGRD